jgi:hypothetical protein
MPLNSPLQITGFAPGKYCPDMYLGWDVPFRGCGAGPGCVHPGAAPQRAELAVTIVGSA